MTTNRFDEALEEVSSAHGLNWDDDSKVRLFAWFCQEQGVSFEAWEKFLERQADEELTEGEEEDFEE